MGSGIVNLREFLRVLRKLGQVTDITVPCDPELEIPEIHRRVIEENGKVLFFHNVKGSPFPLVTNLFGTRERMSYAFGPNPEAFVRRVAALPHELMPPSLAKLWGARSLIADGLKIGLKNRSHAPVLQHELEICPGKGLKLLPALKLWPEDGGRFVTLPLVYTEDPITGMHNLGMYRIQIFDEATTGMHWQIGKGGGFHHYVAEQQGQELPVTLTIGGPPALILAAIAPLPESVPELMLASLLMGEKLDRTPVPNFAHSVVSEAEFAIVGVVPPKVRRPEGPFGDHYGYYSLMHDYPEFRVSKIYHRKDAIYPATVVGKPRQEDYYIGDYLQQLLSPLFPVVMPSVVELKSYGETGFHGLAAARVKDRYPREALSSALRILGEGQLSLQKFLMLTDGAVDLSNFKATLTHFLERSDWTRDLFVLSNISQDTLDYTGPKVNEGSKGIWLALGPAIRTLHGTAPTSYPFGVNGGAVFVPGCLVIAGVPYEQEPGFVSRIANDPCFSQFELVVVVDNVKEAVSSEAKFLWTWFTRFEPAADISARESRLERFHVQLKAPVFFDSRMKPWYPAEVEVDPGTKKLVDARWGAYFGR
jgi:4-hydroxybenzoate decarboxylase subunit C